MAIQQKVPSKLMVWMAWRYLVAKKAGNGLSFMTTVSVLGVGVGVAALIIVLSVMGGFERDLKEKMIKGNPHLEVVSENELAGFSLAQHPLAKIQAAFPEAQRMEPYTQADVVLKNGRHLASGVLYGIDPEGGHIWGFSGQMVEGEMSSIGSEHLPLVSYDDEANQWPGLVLGNKLATQLGADVGDEVSILSPLTANSAHSALSGGTLARHFVVTGIFSTGLFNYDSKWAVVKLQEGRKFLLDYDPSLDEGEYVSGVGINVKEPYDIDEVVRQAQAKEDFSGLKFHTWMSSNASLILALRLEKFTMGSILMLIVLVAAFSISGTMMMSVFHKKRQVSLLRSLGMTRGDIVQLFLLQALTIAFAGVMIGLSFGLASCFCIHALRTIELPYSWQFLSVFPVRFLPLEYGVICGFAFLLSLVGAFYPAWMASRPAPSTGLRY